MTLLSYLPCPICYIPIYPMAGRRIWDWIETIIIFQCQWPNQYFCLCNIADRRSKSDRIYIDNTVYLFLDWLFVIKYGLAIDWYATSPNFRYLSYLLSYSKSKVPIWSDSLLPELVRINYDPRQTCIHGYLTRRSQFHVPAIHTAIDNPMSAGQTTKASRNLISSEFHLFT